MATKNLEELVAKKESPVLKNKTGLVSFGTLFFIKGL